jgi:hypothetical protein
VRLGRPPWFARCSTRASSLTEVGHHCDSYPPSPPSCRVPTFGATVRQAGSVGSSLGVRPPGMRRDAVESCPSTSRPVFGDANAAGNRLRSRSWPHGVMRMTAPSPLVRDRQRRRATPQRRAPACPCLSSVQSPKAEWHRVRASRRWLVLAALHRRRPGDLVDHLADANTALSYISRRDSSFGATHTPTSRAARRPRAPSHAHPPGHEVLCATSRPRPRCDPAMNGPRFAFPSPRAVWSGP